MTKNEMQNIFAVNVAKLILHIQDTGEYTLSLGECLRTPLQAWANSLKKGSTITALSGNNIFVKYPATVGGTGILKSRHLEKLAIDINLFKDGKYLSSGAEHKPFGEFWEGLNPYNRWGGRYGDGNHYEMMDSANWKK